MPAYRLVGVRETADVPDAPTRPPRWSAARRSSQMLEALFDEAVDDRALHAS